MSDLLKEAIADAKAVRETALQNAKMALEEAFTPQLKSMLSAKLKEDEIEESDPVFEDEMDDEDDEAEEGRLSAGAHDDEEAEEVLHDDEAEEGRGEPAEGEHDDEEAEEGMHDEDEDDMEEDLDLEAIIKELEAELSEGEDEDDDEAEEGRGMKESEEDAVEESEEPVEEEYEIDEATLEEKDDDEEELDEVDKSSDIGKGDNNRGNTDVSSGIGKGAKLKEVQSELKEYKEAVTFLKNKLHEVNILNAKLLFTNKLFKEYVLDNSQKLKVVETFDRAQTTREIKLVYSTLAEQFGDNSTINRKSIKESASAPVSSTKPSKESSKVISEETEVANRFKKLAGLING